MIQPQNPLALESVDNVFSAVDPSDARKDILPVMEQWESRERRPARALFPLVSRMYFEVYQVPEVAFTAILRGGGEWRWRFCTSAGRVEVTSGSYPTEAACISAIDILREGAGTADFRQHDDA